MKHQNFSFKLSILKCLFIFLIISLVLPVVVMAQAAWQQVGSAVFSSSNQIWDTNIVFDSNDTPYVAYEDMSPNNTIGVMKFDGTSWLQVGSAGISAGGIAYTSLALDSNNTPYIAYAEWAKSDKASVMKFNGTNWVQVGIAGFSAGKVVNIRLSIDRNNTPYVAYSDWGRYGSGDRKASVMKFNGTSWVQVGNAGFSPSSAGWVSFAFDNSNTPYIAYEEGNSKASVMKFDGTSWVQVGSAKFSADRVSYVNLAFDKNNTPYVAYQDNTYINSYKASVMKFDGTNWVYVGSAGFTTGQAKYTSLAIDSNNTLYLAYQDLANSNKASMMKFNGTTWIQAGIAGFSAGEAIFINLALDSSNTPYVVYADLANGYKVSVMKFAPLVVTFTAGENGTITGTTSQTVNEGSNCTAITAVPNTGYQFLNWTGTGGFVTTSDNPLTVTNITWDMAITANFEQIVRNISLIGPLDFGDVLINTTGQQTFTIGNTGNSPLTVSSVSYPPGFSGNWNSGTIPIGGSQTVTVTFSPTTLETYSGTITVNSDKTGGTDTIAISGKGITRIINLTGDTDFGYVQPYTSKNLSFVIKNTGNYPLTVSSITYPAAGFTGNWNNGTIAAGGSQTVTVTFTPTSAQNYTGTITVISDKTDGTNTLPISGTGIVPPNKPVITGGNKVFDSSKPVWIISSGGGTGNGTFRYKVNDSSLVSGAMSKTGVSVFSYVPDTNPGPGRYTLYAQESDNAGNWSSVSSYDIDVFSGHSKGILVSSNSLLIGTAGGSSQFRITLVSPPSSNVEIRMTVSGACSLSPQNVISLSPSNWNTGVGVSVTDVSGGSGQSCNIEFEPAVSADPYFNGMKPETVSVNILKTSDSEAMKHKKAIIVAGGGLGYSGDYLWASTQACANQANDALRFQRYTDANIRYLSAGSADDTTSANLQSAISEWAAAPYDGTNAISELLIYMTGHGEFGTFTLKGSPAAILNADVLKGWLDALQSATNMRVILIYDACYSGSFAAKLKNSAYQRIIITSAGASQVALFGDNGRISFSSPFWNAVMIKGMLNGSFTTAKADIIRMKLSQLPQSADMPVSDLKIGLGLQQASSPINIGNISPDISLGCESTATVSVSNIVPSDRIKEVSVSVNYNDYDKLTDVSVSSPLLLQDPVNPGSYKGTLDGFSKSGVYNVCAYARNMNDKDSEWVCTWVTKTCAANDPVKGNLNNDTSVDLADAILALRVLSGISGVSVNLSGDVNGNNKIGIEEVIYILQKVAGLR